MKNGDVEEEDQPQWVPASKSWEKEIQNVDTIERDGDTGRLKAFIVWNNGKKSKVSIEAAYQKCPQMVRQMT